MRGPKLEIVAIAILTLLLSYPAHAQDPAPDAGTGQGEFSPGGGNGPADSTPADTTPGDTTPGDTAPGGTTPAGTAPTPVPSADLPPIDVIQQAPEPAPQIVQQAPPEEQFAPPTPAQLNIPIETAVPGMGGIDSGTVLMSPVGGAIPIGNYPGGVGRADSSDIERTGDTYLPDVLQQTVPGVILEDAQGNVFQKNLQFRGFDSSPVNGVPQGLAVYQNGVRINESFGDIVNWDFLPDNAIDGMTIIGANPVFGLNAIGGAVTIFMRDGFNYEGAELDVRGGSFGRYQGALTMGGNSGAWGAFLALEGIHDSGYRDFSPARIRRMYTDVGAKGEGSEFHLSFTGANNYLGVTAAAPIQLLDLGWNRTFTSPQTTVNEVAMISGSGSVEATPTLTLSAVPYYRWFRQRHVDGNIIEAEECDPPDAGLLCIEEDGDNEVAEDINGNDFPWNGALSYGSLDRTAQQADSYGLTVQGVEKSPLANMPNQFLLGASLDHGNVPYETSSELGYFGPQFVVNGFTPPFILAEPDDFAPRDINTQNTYLGLFFSDTLEVTTDLAVTVGGRYNFARIKLEDIGGNNPQVAGDNRYYRFNPMAGATYQINSGTTLYGSYAEANRAPTPAELACADPVNPCLIESFLTADPPLEQVVSHTWELGLRGNLASWGHDQKLQWSAGLFRAFNTNDIIAVAAPTSGRGYFQNAGGTLRQGVELGTRYTDKRLMVYANYAFVSATFQNALELSSPDNPVAVPCSNAPGATCVNVTKGDRMPGVPENRFKAGFEYWMTQKWKFGADLVAASNQIYFGDEGNDNTPLAGYATVGLHTSYDVNKHMQFYGIINNLFDSHYGLFGNYFNLAAANQAALADGLGANYFTNSRTITPAAPFTAYGGVRLRY
jgi:iron complex outermembrane recepter protein